MPHPGHHCHAASAAAFDGALVCLLAARIRMLWGAWIPRGYRLDLSWIPATVCICLQHLRSRGTAVPRLQQQRRWPPPPPHAASNAHGRRQQCRPRRAQHRPALPVPCVTLCAVVGRHGAWAGRGDHIWRGRAAPGCGRRKRGVRRQTHRCRNARRISRERWLRQGVLCCGAAARRIGPLACPFLETAVFLAACPSSAP
eukprot:350777-Chlamydomonas_euryale.AAC.6